VAFRGTFDYSLDAKNRLTVPAKFRTSLAEGVVLAKGIERCVELWRPPDYEQLIAGALAGENPLSPKARRLKTFFAANAFPSDLDSAGRVMVPPPLMEHAGLTKEVVVVGAEDSLQLWDRTAWTEFNAALTDEIADITAQLGQPAL
jgi:MraZ protein